MTVKREEWISSRKRGMIIKVLFSQTRTNQSWKRTVVATGQLPKQSKVSFFRGDVPRWQEKNTLLLWLSAFSQVVGNQIISSSNLNTTFTFYCDVRFWLIEILFVCSFSSTRFILYSNLNTKFTFYCDVFPCCVWKPFRLQFFIYLQEQHWPSRIPVPATVSPRSIR